MKRIVHAELILGTPVLGLDDETVGRIEEIRANEDGEVTEFLIGQGALLERLSAIGLFRGRKKRGYRVPWDRIDWSERGRPKLTCPVGELEKL